ncbi:PilZ domain-containing protein [Geotalea toluenoxydans]|uniref:PilZ domain-containing protein n=1 Tax=Geotalea toluenoxydans TaxID=421624 RepID=UPI0006D130EF|nr:PilZ domain-containing protein [Geotalea toluenoxydans]
MTQRKFDRFSFKADAHITYDNVTFTGEVADLSLKGLFVKTTQVVAVNEPVRVSINFKGAKEKFSFTIPATVVHRTDTGIGLSFKRIDMDSVLCEKRAADGQEEVDALKELVGDVDTSS